MNKEEKQAIEEIKKEIKHEKEEIYSYAKWLEIKHLETLLELIDKLQEKIERLLNDNEVLAGIVYCGRQVQIPYTTHLTDTSQFISKKKIKDKIKELEENSSTVSVFKIDILKELLEE